MANIERTEADGILELRLDRLDKKNALTGAMYGALTQALRDAERSDDIHVVLIGANGPDFTAGNDIGDFTAPDGAKPALEFIETIAAFGKPLVAAVNGLAVGVGTTMLLHCDLVYATPSARFVTPFAKLGIVPEAGSSLLLPARIGHARAAAMLLLGEPLDAETALHSGLVTALVPADMLLAHARAKAAALVAMPPTALAVTRRLMRGDGKALAAQMAAEKTAFEASLQGAEAKEAFAAFIEKRPPVFRR